jgi:hypothetical protein
MASPFQQQALQRKFLYGALILVLFTAAWVWRRYSIDPQAFDLAIREQHRGEVELVGAVIRQSLIGSRGFVTCYLWVTMQNQQKRNQWNELEISARALAKLQPHYVQPWLFQSWNLSYNVSVEADRVSDRYFFITRGIQLLGEGERRNHFDPDLRWHMGFFLEHKICQSDDSNTLRSLMQLSSIPPNKRDPARFRTMKNGRLEMNMPEFEKFCQEHPHLVRRLKDGVMRQMLADIRRQFVCETPEAVVKFLEDNYRVPSVYEDVPRAPLDGWQEKDDKLKAEPLERFPVLPPPPDTWSRQPASKDILSKDVIDFTQPIRDEDNGFSISRSWFLYSLEPVPEPGPTPGSSKPITDRRRQRRPRRMMALLFRQYPAIAQQYCAETLQEEGWYDNSGYDIVGWFHYPGKPEDCFSDGKTARVGTERSWSEEAWKRARDYWQRHGEENHVKFPDEAEKANTLAAANRFLEKHKLPYMSIPQIRPESLSESDRQDYEKYMFMLEYEKMRQTSNYAHHWAQALVESKPEAVRARKQFHEAKRLYLQSNNQAALDAYQHPDGIEAWKKILLENKDFRQDSTTQEYTFEVQLRYLRLLNRLSGKSEDREVARMALLPLSTGGGAAPIGLALWLPPIIKDTWKAPLFGGPFDELDDEGMPLIPDQTRQLVYDRLFPGQRVRAPTPKPPAAPVPPATRPAGKQTGIEAR